MGATQEQSRWLIFRQEGNGEKGEQPCGLQDHPVDESAFCWLTEALASVGPAVLVRGKQRGLEVRVRAREGCLTSLYVEEQWEWGFL